MLQGPTFYMAGAFFPTWMLCLAMAIIIVLILRVIFIRTGIDDFLSFRLLTYSAFVMALNFAFAIIIYGL